MTTLYDGMQSSNALYSTCHGAPLYANRQKAERHGPSLVRRLGVWIAGLARKWHDARLRSARLRSLSQLDERTLQELTYMRGDISEVQEILAARYRSRLLS